MWRKVCLFFNVRVLMAIVSADKQCRRERSMSGVALNGFVFKKFSVTALHECDISCEREIRCQSYNYVIAEKSCELNNRTREARPENFHSDPARLYLVGFFGRAPLGSIRELPAESCWEIKASEGKDVISKKYWLELSASGKTALVYCDMEIEEKAVDIAFVIGASGAQASSAFARMVAILMNFANEYEISDDKTRVALVDYNGPAIARVFFNDGYSKANFTSFMKSIPGPGGQPGTLSGAFRKVRDEVFTTRKGERLSAENILVVLTQGNFDENSTEIRNEITNFRRNAVKVIVFAITEEPGIDKWEKISSGINLIVIPEPSKDTEEAKKLAHAVSKGMYGG